MYITITEERYGFAQLACLIEFNTVIILMVVGLLSTKAGYETPAMASLLFSAICYISYASIRRRGVSFRLMEKLGSDRKWVMEDIGDKEHTIMRENGKVEIEV